MKNAYAPCVIKEGDKYRMWYTCIDKHPWHTNYAESADGTQWTIRDKPCIVMDQKWEVKDQVYPMVIKADGVYVMIYGCYWQRRQAHGARVRGQQGWADLDQAPGQPRLSARAEERLGIELHDEPDAAAPARRHLPTLVRRSQPAAVEQPLLRHRHRELEADREVNGGRLCFPFGVR